MNDVTKWESYEDARQRIEARKGNAAAPLSVKKQFKHSRPAKAQALELQQQCIDSPEHHGATQRLTDCGGTRPLPTLSLTNEEESLCTEQS